LQGAILLSAPGIYKDTDLALCAPSVFELETSSMSTQINIKKVAKVAARVIIKQNQPTPEGWYLPLQWVKNQFLIRKLANSMYQEAIAQAELEYRQSYHLLIGINKYCREAYDAAQSIGPGQVGYKEPLEVVSDIKSAWSSVRIREVLGLARLMHKISAFNESGPEDKVKLELLNYLALIKSACLKDFLENEHGWNDLLPLMIANMKGAGVRLIKQYQAAHDEELQRIREAQSADQSQTTIGRVGDIANSSRPSFGRDWSSLD
jgi:hypothetical protein